MDLKFLYKSFSKISEIIKYSDLIEINKESQMINKSNDKIREIDLISNNIIIKSLSYYKNIIGYISEENVSLVYLKKPLLNEKNYILAFDPIDGSKNIISNITVGTIYCLYEYDNLNNKLINIVEAGYCLYGPRVTLVKTNNNIVESFLLNKNNEFEKEKNISFNQNSEKLYCINESNSYSKDINTIISYLKSNKFNQRWVGSMVADCHQILLKGGIFLYPSSNKNPNGKLRLLYEVIPFSYIFKIAGGVGLDCNFSPILEKFCIYDLNKDDIHKPISIILSSTDVYKNILNHLDFIEDIFA